MKKQQCPNCKGFKITERRRIFLGLIVAGVIFSWAIAPLVFIPIGIIGAIMPNKKTCQSCGFELE